MSPLFARILSVLLHPALMPTLIFVVLFFYAYTLFPLGTELKFYLLGFIFCGTFAFPAMGILIFRHFGIISNLELRQRHERPAPFLMGIVFYIVTTYFFARLHISEPLLLIPLGITISSLLTTAITFFYKISVHTVGVSGWVGILLGLQYSNPGQNLLLPTLMVIILTGYMMAARISLRAHTPMETFWGCMLGVSTCFLVFFFSPWIRVAMQVIGF